MRNIYTEDGFSGQHIQEVCKTSIMFQHFQYVFQIWWIFTEYAMEPVYNVDYKNPE